MKTSIYFSAYDANKDFAINPISIGILVRCYSQMKKSFYW